MASLVTLLLSLIVGFIAVEGIVFDPPKLSSRGKHFSRGLSPNPKDSRCEGKENGMYANLNDCTAYYVCYGGTSQDRHCPEGFKFDSIKHCTLDNDADCGKSSPSQAPTKGEIICPEDYGYFPFPGDCHKYITCTDGKPKVDICPDQQYYLNYVGCIDGRQCPQSSSSVCQSPNGLFALPGECSKYIKCVDGQPRLKECPSGLGFDHKTQRCLKMESARCRSNEIHEILN